MFLSGAILYSFWGSCFHFILIQRSATLACQLAHMWQILPENVTKQRANSRPYILTCSLNVQARKQSSQVPVLAGLQQLPPRPVAEDTACLGRRHAFGVGDDLENRVPEGLVRAIY